MGPKARVGSRIVRPQKDRPHPPSRPISQGCSTGSFGGASLELAASTLCGNIVLSSPRRHVCLAPWLTRCCSRVRAKGLDNTSTLRVRGRPPALPHGQPRITSCGGPRLPCKRKRITAQRRAMPALRVRGYRGTPPQYSAAPARFRRLKPASLRPVTAVLAKDVCVGGAGQPAVKRLLASPRNTAVLEALVC